MQQRSGAPRWAGPSIVTTRGHAVSAAACTPIATTKTRSQPPGRTTALPATRRGHPATARAGTTPPSPRGRCHPRSAVSTNVTGYPVPPQPSLVLVSRPSSGGPRATSRSKTPRSSSACVHLPTAAADATPRPPTDNPWIQVVLVGRRRVQCVVTAGGTAALARSGPVGRLDGLPLSAPAAARMVVSSPVPVSRCPAGGRVAPPERSLLKVRAGTGRWRTGRARWADRVPHR